MAANTLTINSTLMCPHGGKVQIMSSNTRVKADGGFVALATDKFMIIGCPFTIPPGVYSPCIQVQWIMTDTCNKINANPTLSQSNVGLCINAMGIPQGPVNIVNTQSKARSS